MLMGSAARGIKGLVGNIDDNLIAPSVNIQYEWLIQNEEMRGFICDNEIITLGSHSALIKEQLATRRMEFLQMTANPVDAQIIGMEGRRYLLEETAQSMHLDLTRIFKGSPPNTNPPPEGGIAPPKKGAEVDQAGNPVSGTDTRTAGGGPPGPPGQPPPPQPGGPQPAQRPPGRAEGGPAIGPVVVG